MLINMAYSRLKYTKEVVNASILYEVPKEEGNEQSQVRKNEEW